MRRFIVLLLLVLAGPFLSPALAQDNPGLVARLIQDNLSAPGREVTVTGFSGALSGEARLERMTFADDNGIWLTLEDVVLDWNRSALLRRRLEVTELSAQRLAVTRLPGTDPNALPEAPKAKASGFKFPELPIVIEIGQLGIAQVELGEPILGQSAVLSLDGALSLADGGGTIDLSVDRLDRQGDRIAIDARYDGTTLSIDAQVTEAEGGLIATALDIPGTPALDLTVAGTGPIEDFSTDIVLASDGVERLRGTVALRGGGTDDLAFAADLSGDLTPLLAPQMGDFLGSEIALVAEGARASDGAIDLSRLDLSARSITFSGSAKIGADGLPVAFDLSGDLADPSGGRLDLPGAEGASIAQGRFRAGFDASQGETWTLDLALEGPQFSAYSAERIALSGGGAIDRIGDAGTPEVTARLDFQTSDLRTADSDLGQSLGEAITGEMALIWQQGAPLRLERLTLGGDDYGISASGTAEFGDGTLLVGGEASARVEALSRFSPLAGRPLRGRAVARVTGVGDLLGGIFDVTADVDGDGLEIGIEAADRLLAGPVRLDARLRRDISGSFLDTFELTSTGITASGSGAVGPVGSDLEVTARLADVGLIAPDYTGALEITGRVAQPEADRFALDIDLTGPYGLTGAIEGEIGEAAAQALALDLRLPDIAPLVPAHSGAVAITGTAADLGEGAWDVALDIAGPYAAQVDLDGRLGGGSSDLTLDARLPDLAPLVPSMPGAVRIAGRATETGAQWSVDLDVSAPQSISAQVAGLVGDGRSRIDLTAGLPDVAPFAPGFTGAVALAGTAAETGEGRWNIGLDLEGPYDLTARLDGPVGDGRSALDLTANLPDIAPFVPQFTGAVTLTGTAAETGEGRWDVGLDAQGPYGLTARLDGPVGDGRSALDLTANLPDIAPFAPQFTGAVTLTGTAAETGEGRWDVGLDAQGPYGLTARVDGPVGDGRSQLAVDARLPDVAPLAPGVTGPVALNGTVSQTPQGRWSIQTDATELPFGGSGQIAALVGGTAPIEARATLRLPDLSAVVPQLSGAAEVRATARQDGSAWVVDANVDGPSQSTAQINARIDEQITASVQADLPSLAAFAPGLPGGAQIQAEAAQDGAAWVIDADIAGPYNSTVQAALRFAPADQATEARITASLPSISPLAPGLAGPLRLTATATQSGADAYDVAVEGGGPYGATAQISGQYAPGQSRFDLNAAIPNIAPLAPGLSGPLRVTGTASEDAAGWAFDLTSNGPGAATARVNGTADPGFATMALRASGSAPLALANQIIAPRQILGTLQFDLALNGRPALESLTGTITAENARLSLPTLSQTFSDIDLRVSLNQGTATVDAGATGGGGGRLTVQGPVRLTGGFDANLAIDFDGFALEDPTLYSTELGGGIRIAGPLTGGALIDGRIRVGRTEIRVPSGGLGFGGSVPRMTHLNEPGSVHLTRVRAGAIETAGSGGSGGSGGGGAVYRLDLIIDAPNQIFVRGRGLDMELGGSLRLTGTTAQPIPIGGIEVIRGTLSILGQRLDISSDSQLTLAGNFQPVLDISAVTEADDLIVTVAVTGAVDDPEITFSSSPELPQDEVLARLLFGRDLSNLSAFQAAQLASSVATLTGRGGPGLLGSLREGLGLDDLDVRTTEAGGTEVTAGRYLSDNIYTDVTTGGDGSSTVRLNIDITDTVRVTGKASSDGETSIGIFYERDY